MFSHRESVGKRLLPGQRAAVSGATDASEPGPGGSAAPCRARRNFDRAAEPERALRCPATPQIQGRRRRRRRKSPSPEALTSGGSTRCSVVPCFYLFHNYVFVLKVTCGVGFFFFFSLMDPGGFKEKKLISSFGLE